jgi:hypothetical protein
MNANTVTSQLPDIKVSGIPIQPAKIGDISQMVLFTTTAVRTSDPINLQCAHVRHTVVPLAPTSTATRRPS